MKRWKSLWTAGGATATATTAVGTAATQEGGGGVQAQPDFSGYLDGVDGGYEDLRGQNEVTIEVGASGSGGDLAFAPAGIWIDPGTAATWKRTGEGGDHNVVTSEGASLNSGAAISETGSTYEHTLESGSITKYHRVPHEALDVLGTVAVGDGVTATNTGSGGKKELHELGVPIQAHWVELATVLGILVTIIYTSLILKYDKSPSTGNTGGGE